MNEMTAKKLAAIMEDKAANEKLSNANGVEEVVAILNEYGVEISAHELNEIIATVPVNGELSMESLDQVAGGGWWQKTWDHIKSALNGLFDGFNGD